MIKQNKTPTARNKGPKQEPSSVVRTLQAGIACGRVRQLGHWEFRPSLGYLENSKAQPGLPKK